MKYMIKIYESCFSVMGGANRNEFSCFLFSDFTSCIKLQDFITKFQLFRTTLLQFARADETKHCDLGVQNIRSLLSHCSEGSKSNAKVLVRENQSSTSFPWLMETLRNSLSIFSIASISLWQGGALSYLSSKKNLGPSSLYACLCPNFFYL